MADALAAFFERHPGPPAERLLGALRVDPAPRLAVWLGGVPAQLALEPDEPGDRLEAAYLRHGKPRQATIALRGHPARTLVTRESAGETPTPEELTMRDAWLGSRAK